ncbi:hypothetical protein KCU98_g13425, partial [Aureobasidium melanogenum]
MSVYITLFENVVRFSIKHIGAEKTYEICTTLILHYARVKQAQIIMESSSLLACLMIPAIASIIISLTASSTHMRVGPPLVMLVILLLAIDAELAPYRLSH